MADNTTLIPLVQAGINALTGSSTLNELLQVKIAAVKLGMDTSAIDTLVNAIDQSGADTKTLVKNAIVNELRKPEGFTTHLVFTSSDTLVLPAYVKTFAYSVQSGGGGGARRGPGNAAASGGGAGNFGSETVNVEGGETLTIVVGAGGAGSVNAYNAGTAGGESSLLINGRKRLYVQGGGRGEPSNPSAIYIPVGSMNAELYQGGTGRTGNYSGGYIRGINSSGVGADIEVASRASAGAIVSGQIGGGGGGTSMYGGGGNGGDGHATNGLDGDDAVSFGGGGGGGGSGSASSGNGGAGADGIVEVWY